MMIAVRGTINYIIITVLISETFLLWTLTTTGQQNLSYPLDKSFSNLFS